MANVNIPAVRQGVIAGTTSFIWSKVVLPWAVPLGAPAVTAILGWAQNVPWMWIWTAALASPFFALASLREFEARRKRTRVEGNFTAQFMPPGLDTAIVDGRRKIMVVQTRLMVRNAASFPISFVVDDISTVIENHAHRYRGRRTQMGGIVGQDGGIIYQDQPVEIPGGIADERISIRFRYSGRYGRPGNENIPFSDRMTIEVANIQGRPVHAASSPQVGVIGAPP